MIQALEGKILKARGVIRLNEAGVKITIDKGQHVQLITDKGSYTFDKLIATVPSPVFARLLEGNVSVPDDYRTRLTSVEYLGAICIILRMKTSLSRYYWMNIHETESPFLVYIEHTNLIPKEHYQGSHLYYLGTYVPHSHRFFTISDDDIRKEFFAYMHTIFPHFDERDILESRISRLKHAQHIVDTAYQKKIVPYRTPLSNVYLSNLSQIFPEDRGTNFAVREGYQIAKTMNE